MSYLPIASDIAVRATREAMNGAGAQRPVHEPPRRRRRTAVRASLAAALRRVASWVEPRDLPRPTTVS